MKHNLFTGLLAISLSLIAGYTHAQVKIGYADVQYIVSQLPEAKQAESNLLTYEKQYKSQMENKLAEYEKKLQDYQKLVASGMGSQVVIEDKEKELINMQNSIKDFEEKAQADLQKRQAELLKPIFEKTLKSIEKVASANGYTHIFTKNADSDGSLILLYAKNKEDDISNLVLKDMGVTPPPQTPIVNTGSK
ncbi:MAG: OmpH family outer membrane protein [Cytophagaceae bacterium]|nr:OmpH family outer membrane protein [Cytophagaceae bacterium]MDW8455778.1 OmpH family outer membrane protein [Cytophagaceae bacterium]